MQLFTHLLSSYLQGTGDFFSALYTAWGSTNIQWATCSEKTWQIYGVVSAGFHSEEEPS